MFFVCVAEGDEGRLLVDKKKINSKDADEAKKKCGDGPNWRVGDLRFTPAVASCVTS